MTYPTSQVPSRVSAMVTPATYLPQKRYRPTVRFPLCTEGTEGLAMQQRLSGPALNRQRQTRTSAVLVTSSAGEAELPARETDRA